MMLGSWTNHGPIVLSAEGCWILELPSEKQLTACRADRSTASDPLAEAA